MNRADLIAAMQATAGQPPKKVEVAGWGTLYVRSLTVEQVDLQQQQNAEIARELQQSGGKDRLRFARGAARVMCDEAGKLFFDVDNPDDLELLAAQPWDMLQKVVQAANDENAVSEEGSAAVKKD
jgi:hypothetical protein